MRSSFRETRPVSRRGGGFVGKRWAYLPACAHAVQPPAESWRNAPPQMRLCSIFLTIPRLTSLCMTPDALIEMWPANSPLVQLRDERAHKPPVVPPTFRASTQISRRNSGVRRARCLITEASAAIYAECVALVRRPFVRGVRSRFIARLWLSAGGHSSLSGEGRGMSRVSHAVTCVHCIVITISHLARLAIYNSPETLSSGYDV